MQRMVFVVLAFLFVQPAQAQTAEEQLHAAISVFRTSYSNGEPWLTHPKVTEYLAGRWLVGADALLGGGTPPITPDLLQRACSMSGSDVTASQYTITMRKTYKRIDGSQAIRETIYVDRGGNSYGYMTQPEQFLDSFGLAGELEEKHWAGKYKVLREASGIAEVFRPSKDILVILPTGQRAQFAMRCP